MLKDLIIQVGPWSWLILGFVLLILEIMVPGSFFLWFALAALVSGVVAFVLGDLVFWGWQIQLIVFVVLSTVFVVVGRHFMTRKQHGGNGFPLINKRARQMIGREAILIEGIEQGVGRVKLGDTIWRVSGEDAEIGTKVKIIGVKFGTTLVVESL